MRFILLFFLLISISGFGQWKDYVIGVRGDTLNRVDMKGKKQGPWTIHVDELRGERGYEEEGYFLNDLKDGTWKKYSLEGVKIAEENYRWGKLDGKQQYFTYNGGLIRVENWRMMDPANQYDTVPVYDLKDPTKEIDRVIVKNEGLAMKHGRWTFYDPVWGTEQKSENYFMNKLQTDDGAMFGDDEIKPISITSSKSDTSGKKAVVKPKEVLEYEKKNSGKKKIKVRDGSTGYTPNP